MQGPLLKILSQRSYGNTNGAKQHRESNSIAIGLFYRRTTRVMTALLLGGQIWGSHQRESGYTDPSNLWVHVRSTEDTADFTYTSRTILLLVLWLSRLSLLLRCLLLSFALSRLYHPCAESPDNAS